MSRIPRLLALALAGPAAAQAPSLSHTAPLIGQTVTLTVSGLSPGSTVGLLHSHAPAAIPTPLGTLELDPAGLSVVASGTADAAGSWGLDVAVPANASWAELEAHLQPIELTPGAPRLGVLGSGAHLRFLGSRVYAQVSGSPAGYELLAFSAAIDEEVFVFALPGEAAGEVVVSADRSLGAVPLVEPEDQLVVFDNYFGGVVEVRPLPVPLAAMHPGGDGYYLWHAASGDLELVDLATGAVLQTLAVPGGQGAIAFDEAVARAAVDVGGSPPSFVVLDLGTGAISGPVGLGLHGDTELELLGFVGDTVVGTTSGSGQVSLAQVDLSATSPAPLATDLTPFVGWSGSLVVPDAQRVLFWNDAFVDPSTAEFEPWWMIAVPLGVGGVVEDMGAPVPPPGSGLVDSHRWEVDGPGAWFTDRCCQEPPDGDERGALWYLDATTATWSATPETLFYGPREVAVVEDAFGSRVFVTRDTPAPLGFGETAEIVAFDQATLEEDAFGLTLSEALGSDGVLSAVTVP